MKKHTFLFLISVLFLNYGTKAQDGLTHYGTLSGEIGAYCTFLGYEAGRNNSSKGRRNSFFGYHSGLKNTTGSLNSFFGKDAGLYNTSGSSNSFFGEEAGYKNSTGSGNSFFGESAGYSTTSSENSFFGYRSGLRNTTGSLNSFFGKDAGLYNTSGSSNSFFGESAGYHNESGSGNLFLGYKAGYSETGSNKLYISNSDTSTPLVYGEFDKKQIRLNGQVGIGTNAANLGPYQLAVEGTIGARKVVVSPDSWADFVFENNYKLRNLQEVETFINNNKHLPDVPSEKEVLENGVSLGEMDAVLLQKIEELTLYIIELKKYTTKLEKHSIKLDNNIIELKKDNTELKRCMDQLMNK